MPDVHTHEIVLRGRIGRRVLAPFLDDFTVDHADTGLTRLTGAVRDPSHLHGLVAYLASINAELIAITPVDPTPSSAVPSNPVPSNRIRSNPIHDTRSTP